MQNLKKRMIMRWKKKKMNWKNKKEEEDQKKKKEEEEEKNGYLLGRLYSSFVETRVWSDQFREFVHGSDVLGVDMVQIMKYLKRVFRKFDLKLSGETQIISRFVELQHINVFNSSLLKCPTNRDVLRTFRRRAEDDTADISFFQKTLCLMMRAVGEERVGKDSTRCKKR